MTTRRQIARNTVTNLAIFGLQSAVGLLFTPYLVDRLGVAAYGLVPLAISVGTYVGIATIGVQTSVGRYLTISIKRGDDREAGQVFATSLWLGAALSAGFGLLLLLVASNVTVLFNVPRGAEEASRAFFLLALGSYPLIALRDIVGAVPFAHNRLDVLNAGRATDILLRVAVPVAAFAIAGPSLPWVGVGMFAGAVASFALIVRAWRATAPGITGALGDVSRAMLRPLLGTSAWVTLAHTGTLLHLSIDLVVVNLLLGPTVAGGFGTVAQWPVFLRSITGAFVMVLTPLTLARVAVEDYEGVARMLRSSVRLIGLAVGLLVGLVVGFGGPLLLVWLGPEFVRLWPLLAVSVGHLSFNLAVSPLFALQTALNKVKLPALMAVSTGVLNAALSVWWAGWGEAGIGVAAATFVALSIGSAVFVPLYAAHNLGIERFTFVRAMLPGAAMSAAVMAGSYSVTRLVAIDSWLAILAAGAAVALPYAVVSWRFLLTEQDRRLLVSAVRRAEG